MQQSPEQRTLLNCISSALFGTPCEENAECITPELLQEARNQSVPAVAFSGLSKEAAASPEAADWSALRDAVLARNMQVQYAHAALHRLLDSSHIPYVFLKGIASAAYYPQPMLRSMGDVDFYVSPENIAQVNDLLLSNGFRKTSEAATERIHLNYVKDGVSYELHHRINGISDNPAGRRTEACLAGLLTSRQLLQSQFGPVYVPSILHHGILLLLHSAQHLLTEGLGLRHLCDWAVYIPSVTKELPDTIRSFGLWKYACILTACCEAHLGLPKQPWAESVPDALADDLLEDILHAGNFGKKLERSYEYAFVRDSHTGGNMRRTVFGQFLSNLNIRTREVCPFTEKCPLLLPLGWAFLSIRYLLRVLTGKRKPIRLNSAIEGAEKRRRLYAQFALFQTNEELTPEDKK